ncbi:MAG TPA: flagellar hook-associated protein FlgK, partial [Epulopiscium sp.]|nr:flagellar hook-associated protein FlgK [Candidatus Epulonipiscium sp.]
ALVEGVFGEPSDVGFTNIFNDFFDSLDDLSKIPDEGERKVALMQNMKSFTQYFNSTASSLEKYQRDLNFEVKNKVDEINIISRRLESLNKQIYQAEIHSGGMANALRDERELQIDRLSEIVNVDAKEYEVIGETGAVQKRYSVKVNGQTLVDHFTSRELDIKVRGEKNNPEDVEGLYDIQWKDGLAFKMNDLNLSGELKGAIDMRDGNAKQEEADGQEPYAYRGIPYYIQRLNNFVVEFSEALNEVYRKGISADSDEESFLFEFEGGTPEDLEAAIVAALVEAENPTDPEDIATIREEATAKFKKDIFTAANFRVNPEILDDPSKIRTTTDKDKLPGGNDLILDLMGLKHDRKMFKEGEANDYMISIFSELGINAKEANMYSQSQSNMVNAIENQRLSVSQVDQNEEMLSLVKYQQAYQAAARIITTMDTIYDITINRMGIS